MPKAFDMSLQCAVAAKSLPRANARRKDLLPAHPLVWQVSTKPCRSMQHSRLYRASGGRSLEMREVAHTHTHTHTYFIP